MSDVQLRRQAAERRAAAADQRIATQQEAQRLADQRNRANGR